MYRKAFITLATAAALGACTHQAEVRSAAGDVAPATPATARRLPVGTTMRATFDQDISTSSSRGDAFSATVTENVIAKNGQVAVPAGTKLRGHVTGIHKGGVNDRSVIRLNFDRMDIRGKRVAFNGAVSDVDVKQDRNNVARNIAAGTGAGVLLGAVLSGAEVSKMIAGGLLGAAAGTAVSLGTGDAGRAKIPAGSSVTVRSTRQVNIK